MVIEDVFFPQCPGGYLKQGYGGGGYGHSTAGYNFSDQNCYGNNSSPMKMAMPNITTPSEPAKHFVVDTENHHGHGHDKSHGFSHQHHSAGGGGGGTHQQHGVDGMFGTANHMTGGYMSGFGYPSNNKPAFPFVGGGGGTTYEYERESYCGDGGMNRFQTMGMPFHGMQVAPPGMHAAGYNHWAAGKGAGTGSFTNSKGI